MKVTILPAPPIAEPPVTVGDIVDHVNPESNGIFLVTGLDIPQQRVDVATLHGEGKSGLYVSQRRNAFKRFKGVLQLQNT